MFLIAHRGNNNHEYRENSREAFCSCFNTSYIDGVELDVRLTKDHVVVLSHDNLVNGKLIDRCIYSKIKDHVDTLDDVLGLLSNKKKILIDIKCDEVDIVDCLYDVLKKYNYNLYICSFNEKILKLFKKRYFSYKVGLIIGYMINVDKIHNRFDFNSLHYNLINRINFKKEVFMWTVNDRFVCERLKKFKNINVITDKAYLLK